MPKKFIRRFLPHPDRVRNHHRLRMFGERLTDPNLWHLNRRSASGAFAVGLFMAFVPMPFQMIPAAALAILFRVNLPISVALVWLTNPLTMPPLFYFAYIIGAWLLSTPPQPFAFEISWDWARGELLRVWQPFLLGCLTVGTVLAASGYGGIRLLWRWHVVRDWERRRHRKRQIAS